MRITASKSSSAMFPVTVNVRLSPGTYTYGHRGQVGVGKSDGRYCPQVTENPVRGARAVGTTAKRAPVTMVAASRAARTLVTQTDVDLVMPIPSLLCREGGSRQRDIYGFI